MDEKLQKSIRRISRAVEFARSNNYAASVVYGIVAVENLRLRIRLLDEEYSSEEEKQEALKELVEFVQYSARAGLSIQAVETFLYSRGATFEVVSPDGEQVGVIDPASLETELQSNEKAEEG